MTSTVVKYERGEVVFSKLKADQPFVNEMIQDMEKITFEKNTLAIVSPDVGGVVRARAFAKRINASLVIIDKRREKAGESEVMNIIGEINNRICILLDDIADSAGTLCNAALALKQNGAKWNQNGVTMESQWNQMKPNGAKWIRKGAQREPTWRHIPRKSL